MVDGAGELNDIEPRSGRYAATTVARWRKINENDPLVGRYSGIDKKSKTKKIIFIFALLSLICTVLSNVIASSQKEKMTYRESAIIMEPSVTVRSTPSTSGTELFILHEGKKVTIKDDSMKDWKEIEIEDGNIGWLPASAIEQI